MIVKEEEVVEFVGRSPGEKPTVRVATLTHTHTLPLLKSGCRELQSAEVKNKQTQNSHGKFKKKTMYESKWKQETKGWRETV